MKTRLVNSFDFGDAPKELPLPFKVWAEHTRRSEKYFLAKKISLYTFENDEYVGLIDCSEGLSLEAFNAAIEESKRFISKMKVDEDHMSSFFTIAFICPQAADGEVVKALEKTKFHKDYRFTLRGWADLALILVDLETKKIYSNKLGKKRAHFYEFEKQA